MDVQHEALNIPLSSAGGALFIYARLGRNEDKMAISVIGGAAGAEINRDVTCNATPQSAAAGSDGQIFSSYTFARSTSTAGYCRFLLPSKLLYFRAILLNKKVRLSWEILNPELVKDFTIERKNTNNQWKK